MSRELILIRGLPGSGKSTLAQLMCNFDCYDYMNVQWFEADMFFMKAKPGTQAAQYNEPFYLGYSWSRTDYEFVYDREKIPEAHRWCRDSTRNALVKDGSIVIVSNTFSRIWEMQPYIDMAKELNAKLTVITCEGSYGNVHDVPEEVVEKMRKRWEKYDG